MDTTKRTRGLPRMTHNMIFSDDYTTALPICLAANRGGVILRLSSSCIGYGCVFCVFFNGKDSKNNSFSMIFPAEFSAN